MNIPAVSVSQMREIDRIMIEEIDIKPSVTLTLALPKVGLIKKVAKEFVGKLYLADLSVPQVIYKRLNLNVPTIYEKNESVLIN